MRLKHALWATAAWTVLLSEGSLGLVVVSLVLLREDAADRALYAVGVVICPLTLLGYLAIWVAFAATSGNRRRESRDDEEWGRGAAEKG